MNAPLRTVVVLAGAALTLTLHAACAQSVSSEGDPGPALLTADASTPTPLTVCVATDCPAPWATCAGGGLCATDTRRDIMHCGACGAACLPPPPAFHATAVCAGSRCALACDELSADCNHKESDGCETFTGDDPKNCGGCGNACKAGEVCWKGACGCPSGFTRCGDECKNLGTDDLACGSCDSACVPPSGADPEWKCGPNVQPTNTDWGCTGGGCKIVCSGSYGDCDHDLCANGCETDERSDPLNCGACGRACEANQACVDGACLCPPGTTRCGKRCVDVNVDPNNCGACGNGCPGAEDETANGTPTCTGGRCGYLCYAGFEDCDNRTDNGCEAKIASDPLHCGSCATKCDAERSQPCVLGQCLTKPCEPGPGTF
jgi:hypothetical protein